MEPENVRVLLAHHEGFLFQLLVLLPVLVGIILPWWKRKRTSAHDRDRAPSEPPES